MPKPRENRRDLRLSETTDTELDGLSVVSPEDQQRIAARFRATTVPQMRALLDGPAIEPKESP